MFDIELIPHKDISSNQLEEIINLKSNAWPYSRDSQLVWIAANLKESDIHVLLSENKKNIAYLNLIQIEIKIDGTSMFGFGVGNVCASKKGKGWGKELMAQTNSWLTLQKKIGLLFCKKNLVDFYSSNNWLLIEKEKLVLSFNDDSIETLGFNLDNEFQRVEYLGKPI